jgi:hypothetical protein
LGQRISGQQRGADRRNSSSTDILDRAVSLVVGDSDGDGGVERCGAPREPLTGPYAIRPSPSRFPAAFHAYLQGATLANPSLTGGTCGQAGV